MDTVSAQDPSEHAAVALHGLADGVLRCDQLRRQFGDRFRAVLHNVAYALPRGQLAGEVSHVREVASGDVSAIRVEVELETHTGLELPEVALAIEEPDGQPFAVGADGGLFDKPCRP